MNTLHSLTLLGLGLLGTLSAGSAHAARIETKRHSFLLDSKPFDMWGIRTAGASQTQAMTDHLIARMDEYLAHGVNTVSVFYMGSSAGYSDPFSSDGSSIDPAHQKRMEQIIKAADRRGMVVIVGIFYQRCDEPRLEDWEASREAVKTVTRSLKPYGNVIINIANEQNSERYKRFPWSRVREVPDLIDLCRLVKTIDPDRVVGAGGYDHENNEAIGRSQEVDVLLFDTTGPQEPSGRLYERFLAAGVKDKPVVNVETFGAWTNQFLPQGVFPEDVKRVYTSEADDAARHEGLYVHFHNTPWCQAFVSGEKSRYDLGGQGTKDDPGIRWYFEYVRKKRTDPASRIAAGGASDLQTSPTSLVKPIQQRDDQPGASSASADPQERRYLDLEYVPNGHPRQRLDLHLPAEGKGWPLIVWVHGGAWRAGDKKNVRYPLRLLKEGYAVASVGYRLSQDALFPAQIEDGKAAIRWLRANAQKYGYNADRIGVWGASAGGHLVALLGMTGHVRELEVGPNKEFSSRVQAVCDFYGPTDFLQMDEQGGPSSSHNSPGSPESALLGGPIQERKGLAAKANPIAYIRTTETRQIPPFLIVHGDSDKTVPMGQSVLLYEALQAARAEVEFQKLSGSGHGAPAFESPEMLGKVAAFFDKHLKQPPVKKNILGNEGFESGGRRNLIWEDGFESGGWQAQINSGSAAGSLSDVPQWFQSMNQSDYSARAVTSPVRAGKYAMRFEWRAENYVRGSNTSKKATLLTGKEPTCREERWWGFSMYCPSEGMQKDSKPEILVQWHSTPDKGEAWTNPPLALRNLDDQLTVTWIHDTRKITPDGWRDWDWKRAPIGAAPKDRWVDWVWHIKWDPWGKGLLEVWMDGKKVVDEKEIAIGMNDDVGNYMGVGLYKYEGTSDHARRVVYFDEIRGGNAQATYADVAPGEHKTQAQASRLMPARE
jgi:acetyl esterase/lipase